MSRRRGGHGGGGHGGGSSERWLLTYADLITLLLAFFVILYAMSKSDYHKMYDLSRSLSSAFHASQGGNKDVMPPSDPHVLNGGFSVLPESAQMMQMQDKLEQQIVKENGPKGMEGVRTTVNERGLVISLSDSAFFDAGDANLRPATIGVLKTVARTLLKSGRNIMIEGHTDNTPINTMQFPSNWELSTARATSVVKWLITSYRLPPDRLSASGYGEYHPLVANTTPENRAKNRRIDIVILRSDLKGQRPGGML
jgi:chemotaxis protein MotB